MTGPTTPTAPTAQAPAAVDVTAASRARTAWLEVLDAIAQGCPVPMSVSIASDGTTASVALALVAQVERWAAFLGLSAPETFVCLSEDGTRRLTSTNAAGRIGHGTYVSAYHLRSEPADRPGQQSGGGSGA